MLDTTEVTEQLMEARAFADSIGLREQFEKRLAYLDTYAEHGDRGKSRCHLFPDFAPYSFSILMQVRNGEGEYRTWFNGGLIFHGPTDGGAPNFSVSLSAEQGWQVHT